VLPTGNTANAMQVVTGGIKNVNKTSFSFHHEAKQPNISKLSSYPSSGKKEQKSRCCTADVFLGQYVNQLYSNKKWPNLFFFSTACSYPTLSPEIQLKSTLYPDSPTLEGAKIYYSDASVLEKKTT